MYSALGSTVDTFGVVEAAGLADDVVDVLAEELLDELDEGAFPPL